MPGVFISYRRDDSQGSAGRLYDDLRDELGGGLVFRDVDTIEPGTDYRSEAATIVRWRTSSPSTTRPMTGFRTTSG